MTFRAECHSMNAVTSMNAANTWLLERLGLRVSMADAMRHWDREVLVRDAFKKAGGERSVYASRQCRIGSGGEREWRTILRADAREWRICK